MITARHQYINNTQSYESNSTCSLLLAKTLKYSNNYFTYSDTNIVHVDTGTEKIALEISYSHTEWEAI